MKIIFLCLVALAGGHLSSVLAVVEPNEVNENSINVLPLPPIIPILFPNLTDSDPYFFKDVSYNFDSRFLRGRYATVNSSAYGHAGVTEEGTLNFGLNPVKYIVEWDVEMRSFTLDGIYDTDLNILDGFTFFSGNGEYKIQLQNISVKFDVTILPTENPDSVTLDPFESVLTLGQLEIMAENAELNCQEAIWEEIAGDIRIIVETYWPTLITRIVKPLANELLKHCNLNDLIAQDFRCIGADAPIPDFDSLLKQLVGEIGLDLSSNKAQWENPCLSKTSPPPHGSTNPASTTRKGSNDDGNVGVSKSFLILPTLILPIALRFSS